MNDVKSFEQTVQCVKVSPINARYTELCIVSLSFIEALLKSTLLWLLLLISPTYHTFIMMMDATVILILNFIDTGMMNII